MRERRTAMFERFQIRMDLQDAMDASSQGDCEEACKAAMPRARFVALSEIAARDIQAAIRAELEEYGAWDSDELGDTEQNRLRIVWIAAGNIREDERA